MNKLQTQPTKQLQQEYEAIHGIQGSAIWQLSRAQLIDGITNPAHVPAHSRRNRRTIKVTPADMVKLS